MTRIQRLMRLHRLMGPAGSDGNLPGGASGSGSGGTGEGGTGDEGGDSGAGGDDDTGDGKTGGDDGNKGNKPSDAEAKLLRDVMKHKERATKAEAKINELTAKIAEFDGIDVAAVRALLAEKEEQERKKAEAKGDYDRLTKQMAEAHAADKKKVLDDLAAANQRAGTLESQIAELTVGNAFSQSAFVRDELTLTPAKARVVYGSHFAFEDGKVVAYDKPTGASDRTVLVNATGEPLSFEDALKKLVETDPDKEHLIRSKVKPGAGSSTAPKGGPKPGTEQNVKLSPTEKIQAGLRALAKQTGGR